MTEALCINLNYAAWRLFFLKGPTLKASIVKSTAINAEPTPTDISTIRGKPLADAITGLTGSAGASVGSGVGSGVGATVGEGSGVGSGVGCTTTPAAPSIIEDETKYAEQ